MLRRIMCMSIDNGDAYNWTDGPRGMGGTTEERTGAAGCDTDLAPCVGNLPDAASSWFDNAQLHGAPPWSDVRRRVLLEVEQTDDGTRPIYKAMPAAFAL